MKSKFSAEVHAGLSRTPKSLPSKYFYDKRGDELFMQIMEMPEYYLTRAEMEIFTEQTEAMIAALGVQPDRDFELIELGAGDGSKTRNLLQELLAQKYRFDYIPVDISLNVLELLRAGLSQDMPDLSIKPEHGDYLEILGKLEASKKPKVVLFLGSNMGNHTDAQATRFVYDLGRHLAPGDRLLLGVDLMKSVEVVLPAYDDAKGVTRDFNLNLLRRINRELGADFDLGRFEHQPEYDEEEGVARSFLVSTTEQVVTIEQTGQSYAFAAGEKVHTEISRKYNDQIIGRILEDTDFEVVDILTDSREYFADYILERQ